MDKLIATEVPGEEPEEVPTAESADPPPNNPFDPRRLRLSQDFAAGLGVKKALVTVPIRKPPREWWVQVHPQEDYRLQTGLLELKEDREIYLVEPDLWPELATEATFGPRALFTALNRQGVLFLWPLRLPGPDGRIDEWSRSALEAATMASGRWVRVVSNMSLGAYEVFTTEAAIPAPEWPVVPFDQILKTAFRDRFIDSFDHPVLKRLRGEV
ncbi:MAG: hypothetical protein M5U26_13270 [Planctomycetota bacterium]|nr:hypothetical protein [Planctomycetota bacterium]